jgi:hypothetical protein
VATFTSPALSGNDCVGDYFLMMRPSLVVIVLLWTALAVLTLGNTNPETLQFLDDQAFLMGTADAVRRGEVLLSGLPSHLGARHLGPYYVYLQALLSWIGGADPVVVSLLFTTLKLLTPLIIIYAIFCTGAGGVGAYLAGIMVMLASLSGFTIAILRMDWINYFLILVSALFTLAIVRVVTRGASAVPFFLLASTLLIQPHLSPLPILAAGSVGVLLSLLLSKSAAKPCSFSERTLCLLAALVLWIPPIVYEVLYEQNIFAVIANNIGRRPQGAGFAEIPAVFLEFIGQVIAGGALPRTWLLVWNALCLVLLGRKARMGCRSERICIGIALLQCVAMFIAITQVKPPVHHYYLISLYGPLLYLWGLAAQEACHVVYQRLSRQRLSGPALALATSVLGIFVWSWIGNLFGLLHTGEVKLSQPYFSLQHARDVARLMREDAGGSSQLAVVARGGARLSANAYYYHLSPELLGKFMYAPRMIELPVIRRGIPLFERGYLVDCGESEPPQTPVLGRRLLREWVLADEVSLADCTSCTVCRMWRLLRQRGL